MTKYICYLENTFLGPISIVATEAAIIALHLDKITLADAVVDDTPLLRQAALELREYFAGRRHNFELPLDLQGTEFQKKVWLALRQIPYGQTRSYREIAEAIGNPNGCRAVGLANNKNPLAILVPCHRVIGSNGSLVGYAGGLELKAALLSLEQNSLTSC